ncbi:hypothetical protein CULT_890003 [[Clostridium] ultunense Esp]|uniref:Uncharacterized protein n=1 Tax=[Clostridium] ultunense Esp TaxID=1288971 RepID=M1ZM74_9FIRM|nr:hypothetical protein CULT_890003 [[Clostridium] ultunense Esp]SHD77648.1 conserved protein of unknown function [[Clostridium] ultunense Esp]
MLLVGILFFMLGLFTILNQKYTVKRIGKERNIVEKAIDRSTGLYKYRIFLGILSIVLGIFCILNYIIY